MKKSKGFKIEGLKMLMDTFDELKLDTKTQANLLKAVHRKNLKIVQKEMIRRSPKNTIIPEYIKFGSDKENLTGVSVGVHKDAFFARFIEYGTVKRTTKAGENRGTLSPKPFIRPAIKSISDKLIKSVQDDYIEDIILKITAKNKKLKKKLS